jgi:protein-disulfide isomerase
MMKKTLLTLFIMSTLVWSSSIQGERKHLSNEETQSIFQTIKEDAIVYGSGKKEIYVFVDPLCKHSQKFLQMIAKKPKMTSKYKYHIFLYAIPRLKSDDVISAIYTSPTPIDTLLEVMVEKKVHKESGNSLSKAKVKRVDSAAKTINVHKRPYIFIKQ